MPPDKQKYVVFRNEGQGGLWMYIYATSPEEIEAAFPEFHVFDYPPRRFLNNPSAEQCATRNTYDLDNPTGWLKHYVEHEQADDWVFQHPEQKGKWRS
jgi:hypothetical protein